MSTKNTKDKETKKQGKGQGESSQQCSVCKITKKYSNYSNSQLRKKENAKCLSCLKDLSTSKESSAKGSPAININKSPKGTTPILDRTSHIPNYRTLLAIIVLLFAIGVGYYSTRKSYELDPIETGIKFLIDKGVLADYPERRELEFKYLRNPAKIPNPAVRSKYEKIRERLLRLINQTEETHFDTVPDGVHEFSEKEFPGYKKENVFFLEYSESLVQRYQLSGLCYMHAPAVVQYYAISKTLNGTNHKQMIDLLKVVKDHFTAKELEHHIFDDMGGDSRHFLEKILEPNSTTTSIGNSCGIIPSNFDKYGVGLVSQFKVHQDFLSPIRHHHYGLPSGSFAGHHAMALVGYRRDGDKLFFLLQNWWKTKQFVEIDEEYLEKSGANIHFIKTPQTSIPSNFSTHSGHFFELEAIDKPEGFVGEMRKILI